jgi:hypothetical protein
MATTSDRSFRSTRRIARAFAALAAFAMGGGLLCAGAVPALAAPGDGYLRLAHLSPDTPAVDVYLYSAGKKTPRLVLKHVGYGALSPYQRLNTGTYTVAMRPADAAAASPPVLSANLRVRPGGAYTVAGMGPYKGIKLRVLNDTWSVPAGGAALRVVVASLKQPTVDVTINAAGAGRPFASDLRFPEVTEYRPVSARYSAVGVTGDSGKMAWWRGQFPAGTSHTCVILDGKSGLRVLHLRDAAQGSMPRGGVDAGLGGLARADRGNVVPWQLATLVALAALVAAARPTGIGAVATLRPRRRA